MRFVDKFDPTAQYVALTYWGTTSADSLNVWRVIERRDVEGMVATVDVENVSDWRGLHHVNVYVSDTSTVKIGAAREACAEGLRRARRDHRNMMRRTVDARSDGADDGRAAGSWLEVNGPEHARRILDALEDGSFYDQWETEYPQTYARDDEKWTAYVEAYDRAESEEIERAARYQLADNDKEIA